MSDLTVGRITFSPYKEERRPADKIGISAEMLAIRDPSRLAKAYAESRRENEQLKKEIEKLKDK